MPDPRKAQGKQYRIDEMMMGGLTLFLLKEGSRNQMNNHRRDGYFCKHYHQMFAMNLPHQDQVSEVLCALPYSELEQLKMDLMSALFEQKWLRQYRLLDRYYMVAVDATGVMSFEERHCEHCLTKTSKSGKTTYFHYVLEAKLVTHDGHALSLASEWIENPEGEFEKQDCELKAFIRLAAKLKKQYPRLPVCILSDGLYPCETTFKICKEYDWKFICVLQDNSLKTVQEELTLTRRRKAVAEYMSVRKGWYIGEEYRYQTAIEYHKNYVLNWVQCIETRNKKQKSNKQSSQSQLLPTNPQPPPQTSNFEYVTNIIPDKNNVRAIVYGGRLRWKIENQGFNTQKNDEYELQHKYCRNSYNGLKNYYTLLQIGHAINQLIEKGKCMTEILKLRPKETVRNLWNKLKHYMILIEPVIRMDSS